MMSGLTLEKFNERDFALGAPTPTPTSAKQRGAERKSEALLRAAVATREKRTPEQVHQLASWLATVPGVAELPDGTLAHLAQLLYGTEYHLGQAVYKAGDPADWYYFLLDGRVLITDVRDPDEVVVSTENPVVAMMPPDSTFGEEEILSSSRRVFTATAHDLTVTVLRLSMIEYKKLLEPLHTETFEAKVAFLHGLNPFKPLKDDVVRKLAPCFSIQPFRKGELLVRQGEKANAMYAICAGSVNVLVDPVYKEEHEGLGELDPKKTIQVVTLDAGNIIGDIAVLASVKKRTASVIAASDVSTFKIRRVAFIRRLPPDQLDMLRRIATEKLKLMDRKIKSRPRDGQRSQVLQGKNLRQLMLQQQSPKVPTAEYQQLVQVLSRYKRSAAPAYAPQGVPRTFVRVDSPDDASGPHGGHPSPGGGGGHNTLLSAALRSSMAPANGPTANIAPEVRHAVAHKTHQHLQQQQLQQQQSHQQALHPIPSQRLQFGPALSPLSPPSSNDAASSLLTSPPSLLSSNSAVIAPPPLLSAADAHVDWRGRPRAADPNLLMSDSNAAVSRALLRVLPAEPHASFPPQQPSLRGTPSLSAVATAGGGPQAGADTALGVHWRPVSPRRGPAHQLGHGAEAGGVDGHTGQVVGALHGGGGGAGLGGGAGALDYRSRPFIAAVTLRTLAQSDEHECVTAFDGSGAGTSPDGHGEGMREGSGAWSPTGDREGGRLTVATTSPGSGRFGAGVARALGQNGSRSGSPCGSPLRNAAGASSAGIAVTGHGVSFAGMPSVGMAGSQFLAAHHEESVYGDDGTGAPERSGRSVALPLHASVAAAAASDAANRIPRSSSTPLLAALDGGAAPPLEGSHSPAASPRTAPHRVGLPHDPGSQPHSWAARASMPFPLSSALSMGVPSPFNHHQLARGSMPLLPTSSMGTHLHHHGDPHSSNPYLQHASPPPPVAIIRVRTSVPVPPAGRVASASSCLSPTGPGSAWSSGALWRRQQHSSGEAAFSRESMGDNTVFASGDGVDGVVASHASTGGGGGGSASMSPLSGVSPRKHPKHFSIDFHTDPDAHDEAALEAALDSVAKPLLEAKSGPAAAAVALRRVNAHFRPTLPKTAL